MSKQVLTSETSKWEQAADKADRTAKVAKTMTRWAVQFSTSGARAGTSAVKPWQLVEFKGPNGAESTGIVDMLAIRRDHRPRSGPFSSGDRFEVILVQVKGGGARRPKLDDLRRLRAVKNLYRAKAVVLASWRKGSEPAIYRLQRVAPEFNRAWKKTSAAEVFGAA